jgi:hypothetical protein
MIKASVFTQKYTNDSWRCFVVYEVSEDGVVNDFIFEAQAIQEEIFFDCLDSTTALKEPQI